ncbi:MULTISPECIES: 5'-nucleotidase, lipoprotein e(P4) family [Vibrio]|nr:MULTISPECIES: HAD family acid phosphatase [Vibrio]MBF9000155.1 hypothetical protein [Vibrio nitrifigilis]
MTLPKRTLLSTALLSTTLCSAAMAVNANAAEANPNDLLNATLWMQNSVEYKANVQGMFQLATMRAEAGLHDKNWSALPAMQPEGFGQLPPAIIVDCDETMLDNNVYEAYLIKSGKGYSSKTWSQYVQDKVTGAMPGAVEFANYAQKKGITIFYVTNRKKENEQATLENMKALGFPMTGAKDVLLTKGEKPDWTSNKTTRDQFVAAHYRVILMLGDNLGDFTDASGTPKERLATYKANQAHWGKDWIMMPNPEYGSFESAAFGGNWSLSTEQRRAEKISALKAWQPKS